MPLPRRAQPRRRAERIVAEKITTRGKRLLPFIIAYHLPSGWKEESKRVARRRVPKAVSGPSGDNPRKLQWCRPITVPEDGPSEKE
jgi:hypothetical protein